MAEYHVDDCWAWIEEDSYEKGCIGGFKYNGRVGYSGDWDLDSIKGTYGSITEIAEEIADYFGVTYTPDCLDLEDWDEEQPGRIDLAWEVNTPEGGEPTEQDWEDFRAGKKNLYYLTVHFIVSRPCTLRYEELKEALAKERAEEAKQTA